MEEERLEVGVVEFVEMALEVCLGTLIARTETHGIVLEAVARRVEFVQMRARVVHADHEEAHAVRPLAVLHRVELCAVSERSHEPRDGQGARVHQPRRERELAHVVAEHTRIAGEPGEAHAEVVINLEHLALVRREL